ncbi:unnamed protein product [Arabidopsis halleri]
MRNGCVPNQGCIYLWKRTSKKQEGTAAKGKVVQVVMEDKKQDHLYEKLTIEECWIREDIEDKSTVVKYVSCSTRKMGSSRGEEATDEKPEKVAEMCRDKDEDAEFKFVVEEELLVHESNKNSSLLEEEGNAGETKEMADENRVNESLVVVEIQMDEKSDELKLIVKQGSESVNVNCSQAEHDQTQYQARPRRPISRYYCPAISWLGLAMPYTVIFDQVREERNQRMQPPYRGGLANEFNKVKTFDLRGVVKSSGKAMKSFFSP